MAITHLTTAVYLFAITSMASAVAVLVHFFSKGNKISFTVVYVWQITLYVLSFTALVLLASFRKDIAHMRICYTRQTTPSRQRRRAIRKAMRDAVIIFCGAGSAVLPLYEAVRDFPCTDLTYERTFYISKFISLILFGLMAVLQLIFLIGFRKYKCVSAFSRVLVALILSLNVSVCINFVLNVVRASNTKTESRVNSTEYLADFKNVLIFSVCRDNTEYMDQYIAEKIYKYTSTLTLEFALFSFGILCPMWNIVLQTPDGYINREGDIDDDSSLEGSDVDDHDTNPLTGQIPGPTRPRVVKVLKKSLLFVSKHSFKFSLLLVLPVLGFQVFTDVDNYLKEGSDVVLEISGRNKTLTVLEKGNYYLQTGYNYVISIVPAVAYLTTRKDYIPRWHVNADNVLLVLSGLGHVLLVLFETADSIAGFLSYTDQTHLTEEILYFIKILFHYIGIYFQVMLILKAQGLVDNNDPGQQDRRLIAKSIIIFLGICNAERWLVDSFLPPTNLRFVNEIQKEDTFGVRNWWFITEFLFPVVTFYRLMSALMFYKVKDRFQNLIDRTRDT